MIDSEFHPFTGEVIASTKGRVTVAGHQNEAGRRLALPLLDHPGTAVVVAPAPVLDELKVLRERDAAPDPRLWPVCEDCESAYQLTQAIDVFSGQLVWRWMRSCKHKRAGHVLRYRDADDPADPANHERTLEVTLTRGVKAFVVTAGGNPDLNNRVFHRAVSGDGIRAGTQIGGVTGSHNGWLSKKATRSGTFTMTIAAL